MAWQEPWRFFVKTLGSIYKGETVVQGIIPQTDPRAAYLHQRAALEQAFQTVMERGWYIMGQECKAFEEEFSAYLGPQMGALGVGSGTDALHVAFRVLDIGPGDGVVTVSHTAVATIAAIELAGATPILVDVDRDSMTMNPERLEEVLLLAREGKLKGAQGLRIKAIVPVHLYGHPADMPTIMDIAKKNGLYVIEDSCQAHGAEISGRKVGTWGDFSAFSFYPTKNLGAFGDGGALVSPRGDLLLKAERMRQYGWKERYISETIGFNSRLDELQAAFLRVRLSCLDDDNAWRRQLASFYGQGLRAAKLSLPVEKFEFHVFHQYVVRSDQRDQLKRYLEDHGVMTAVHYPLPVHLQPAYIGRLPAGPLPETEVLCQQILSLPMYPGLSKEDAEKICAIIRMWAQNKEPAISTMVS